MSKKVFISYSWGTKEHQDWVVNLGKRLMDDTVDVILDKWSLKEGNDIFHFMESMVKAEDIYRVLIICDKNYKSKSDDRNGGVGTETQIITPEIYSNQKQEKFIPLVVERDTENNPLIPIYLSSRKYIDFSNEEYFEDSYEELLRNILDSPSIPKPKLGTKVPLYITESVINNTATNSIVRTLDNQLKKYPEKLNSYCISFIDAFLESLWDFEFKSTSYEIGKFGEELMDNLKSYKILREDFVDFLLIITKPEYDLDIENIINFFEKQPLYSKPRENVGSWNPSNYENFKIIFQELFLYTIAISLKYKNYKFTEELLHSKYYFNDEYSGKTEPKRFTGLYKYNENIESYFSSKFNKITGFGHLIITNLSDKIRKNDMVFADLLCYYLGDLFKTKDRGDTWFPTTYLYKEGHNNFDFFERLSSERHFEKVKLIFDVTTKEELIRLLNESKESKKGQNRDRYNSSGFDSIPFLYEIINIEEIGKNR
ncbi:SEFIR domain-containing protein [Flavobacterium psychrophilum]|uniref:toll/interleukin-1 receptor domain-containing protein n=1 Tax=Flavobacterium psychrophilum TaxID=96345 RepID=UPI000B7C210F|nr:toll/interleukin-1 receptor domain-containing protein [Flavobacterium psychrophilum]MCB6062366.1 toll/interleukin-1 receptor domain-containing protein [Flavobacterium psychrophilum]SNB42322.1 SEFIR domain-containing protein [Flavobacterium psychrophilum]